MALCLLALALSGCASRQAAPALSAAEVQKLCDDANLQVLVDPWQRPSWKGETRDALQTEWGEPRKATALPDGSTRLSFRRELTGRRNYCLTADTVIDTRSLGTLTSPREQMPAAFVDHAYMTGTRGVGEADVKVVVGRVDAVFVVDGDGVVVEESVRPVRWKRRYRSLKEHASTP
ncbi:hypothetical protein ABI59_05880 [Acidobacteria bacterium Mor1]|nr:hypothetical protein ABI59_05880 [Acidobacteria bacterium Mor1]